MGLEDIPTDDDDFYAYWSSLSNAEQNSHPQASVGNVRYLKLRGSLSSGMPKPKLKTVAASKEPIPFAWADDLDGDDAGPGELVEGLLTVGSLAMMYGESNSGKTYMALSLACQLALGEPWLGKRMARAGAVIYIDGERSVAVRLAAFKKATGRMPPNFGVVKTALDLMDPSADLEQLLTLIFEKQNELGEAVSLIVVDTVARAMPGGAENDSQDMGRLIRGADRLREVTGATVLLIHHAGKDSTRGARGHSSLRAAIDTEIEVTDCDGVHMARITKQRDLASKGDSFAARFRPIPLGKNQWGEIRTACVVEATDAPAATPQIRGKVQKAVIDALTKNGPTNRGALCRFLVDLGLNRTTIYDAVKNLIEVGAINDGTGGLYIPLVVGTVGTVSGVGFSDS